MKKKLLSLLLAATLTLAGCTAGSEGGYTTKVKTSEEKIVTSAQFSSGDDVKDLAASSEKTAEKTAEPKQETEAPQQPAGDTQESSGGLPKVWFINNANGIGWSAAFSSSMNETFDTDEYDYTFVDGQGKQEVQLSALEEAIAAKADVVCLSPIQEDGYDDILKKAQDAGVKVLLVDRMVSASDSLYEGWLGSNFDLEGENAGKWLVKEAKGKKMNIVVLQGNKGASAQQGRRNGFNKVIKKHKNFKILAQELADFDKGKAKVLMKKYLKKYGKKKINVIVTHNDTMCYGVMEVLKENKIDPNDYIIISFDGEAEAFKLMMDKAKLDLCVECNPLIGPNAKELVTKILAGEKINKKNYTDEGVYTADMAADELENRQY